MSRCRREGGQTDAHWLKEEGEEEEEEEEGEKKTKKRGGSGVIKKQKAIQSRKVSERKRRKGLVI